jgi:hypothetical protein
MAKLHNGLIGRGCTMKINKIDLVARLQEFERMTDLEKITARLAWLEQMTVEVLWAFISLSSILLGGCIGWIAHQETQSLWIAVPVGLIAFIGSAWFAHRRAFRNAPPHIDFIDP